MQHHSKSGLDKGGLAREKRPLERDTVQDAMPEEKRQKVPALASVIVEAVKLDSLQKLCSSLEPLLRRVVGEEVEKALAKVVPSRLGVRTPPRQIEGSDSSNLRLQFRNKLALPLFTGGKIEGEQGLPIHIVLEDASTKKVVTTGPESATKLEVVVLDGDFSNDEEDWSQEDFENHAVKERDGKRPLLTGELFVTLKEGVGTLGELTFTDNSSWIRSRKFRLGVRVAPGFSDGPRIHECRTEAFTVKDHRGELYKKHYPPRLNDEIWRLDKIGKDGAFHKRLEKNNIRTVEEFLQFYVRDGPGLRHILGSGMSNKMWEGTVEHAKTCVLNGKLYVFYTDDSHNIGVIFNNIYELMGITSHGNYKSVDSLTENEKVYVDKLVKAAYENWGSVTEYDHEALVSENTHKSGGIHDQQTGRTKIGGSLSGLIEQPSLYDQQTLSSVALYQSAPMTSVMPSGTASGATAQAYDNRAETFPRYASQGRPLIQSSQMLSMGNDPSNLDSSNVLPHSFGNEVPMTGLALGPPQSMISTSFGYSGAATFPSASLSHQASQVDSIEWTHGRSQDQLMSAVPVDDYFEEDIRAKSLELLANEEMQQLLRMQYQSIPENFHIQGEEIYGFPTFTPSPGVSFGEDRARTSGKAYVGWLKLKAALRWGIFIRKIAAEKAEKRAQLEELED